MGCFPRTRRRQVRSVIMAVGAVGPRSLVDDALDLASVDAQVTGYGALAVTGVVTGTHHLLRVWRPSRHP
jgi:hypothetical protein